MLIWSNAPATRQGVMSFATLHHGPAATSWGRIRRASGAAGRALGARSTGLTGDPAVDAYLWIKNPGEPDGTCNGGPAAGQWWPAYALGLAQRAAY